MILVTGAAGFIGSNLVFKLVSSGHRVIGFDAFLTGGSYLNLMGINQRQFTIVTGDLRDESKIRQVFRDYEIDSVYHLACETHVDRSISGDKGFWESNVIGTRNLLRCIVDHPEVTKILLQETDEVYGPKETGVSYEGDPLLPTSPYAASKAAQYLVGKSYERTFELPIVYTFPANTYGPRQYQEKLIPKFIYKLLRDEKVPLMKSFHFQRDWLAVEDHVNALIFLMNNGLIGEDYNIPGNSLLTNLSVTETLLRLMDKNADSIEEVPDRKAHDCRYCVDGTKLKTLGWSPSIAFEEYLMETITWYKNSLL